MEQAQDIERRLTDLEIKASFQEDLLEALNQTVFRQQEQLERLVRELVQLKLQTPAASGGPRDTREELPPHY